MHDIGSTTQAYESYENQFGFGPYEFAGEYNESGEQEYNEMQELASAAELLEVSADHELDHFLGNFINDAAKAVGNFAHSDTGQVLGGILKSAAKQALPILGSAVGGYVGGPAGASIGSKLASSAGQMFGLELGEMSAEDRDFTVAKQFVKFAGDAAKRASTADKNLPPAEQAKRAVIEAARLHAPGLVQAAQALNVNRNGTAAQSPQTGTGATGRWVRHGNHIILHGV